MKFQLAFHSLKRFQTINDPFVDLPFLSKFRVFEKEMKGRGEKTGSAIVKVRLPLRNEIPFGD